MLRLILVRHAESEIPRPGLEDEDTRPLTENGLRQSEALGKKLEGINPDAIYSSPYLRAIQTVAPLAESKRIAVEIIEDYREHRMADRPIDSGRF